MTTAPQRTWLFPVLRAIPAAVVALVITFSADHSATLGFLALGSLTMVTGIIIVLGTLQSVYPRGPFLLQGSLLVIGGLTAFLSTQAALPVLLFLASAIFGATGIVELIAGLRARGRTPVARDWIFVGGASALFAIMVLIIPADFSQAISVPDKVVPALTASVIVVGALGAYAAIVAVYLVIAGLSLKWAPPASTTASEAR